MRKKYVNMTMLHILAFRVQTLIDFTSLVVVDMPFSMDKTAKGQKRQNEGVNPSPKVPKAGDIIVLDEVPKSTQSRADNAPVIICIYKYSSDAGDVYAEKYKENRTSLYQLQFNQDCRNNIFFMFKKKFEEFLASTDGVPSTLADLADVASIDFKISPGDNSKGGIFVPWRVGAYVAGDVDAVKNTLLLLDGYFQKQIKSSTGEPIYVHIHPHKDIDITSIVDELDYKYYEVQNPSISLPLKVFECAPVKGGVITLCLQIQSETEMSIVITGSATWAYRNKFTFSGVVGGYASEEDKGTYVRTMKDLDVTKTEDKEKLLKVLGNEVLNDLAVRVFVEGEIEDDSAIEAFVNDLKGMTNMHFQ